MAKKRTGDPWMPAPKYGASLRGLGVNLLVSDVAASVAFAQSVLGAETVYADPDFAVLRLEGSEWMLHADHTYENHPLSGFVAGAEGRGIGAEIRLHGVDPDAAETRARAGGYTVLAGALDKAHGLREVYILDPDGYCWVPDVPVSSA
jgi:catechol 2,3-dioxygenase-like lactoylglutathione lyase family enzyme